MCKRILKQLRNNRGFTFLEIMIVVLIMGILATIVGVNVIGQSEKAKIKAAQVQINNFESALILFKTTCGFYPSTEQGLEALREKPSFGKECKDYPEGGFINKEISEDPWNNPYQYKSPGEHHKAYDIWSDGDTESDNPAPIGNWERKNAE